MLEKPIIASIYILYMCIVCLYDIRYKRIPFILSNPSYWIVLSAAYFMSSRCQFIPFLIFLTLTFIFSFYLFTIGFWGGGDGKVFITSFIFSTMLLDNPAKAYLYNIVSLTASVFLIISFLANSRKMALIYTFLSILLLSLLPIPVLIGALVALLTLKLYGESLINDLDIKRMPLAIAFLISSVRISLTLLSG